MAPRAPRLPWTMPPARKLNRHETTVARVAQLIAAGVVLTAHNAVAREESTVGPYHEAVDRGIKFARLSTKGRAPERMARSAEDAADGFVSRVGSTRANDSAKAAAKKAGITLSI